MQKEFISPSDVFDSRKKYGYWQAIHAGNTIYLAGMTARDEEGNIVAEGDIVGQARQIFENIRRTLAAAGACMNDIVRMTIFCKDIQEFARKLPEYQELAREYFGHPTNQPPGTAIQVVSLFEPALMLEIEATAAIDN